MNFVLFTDVSPLPRRLFALRRASGCLDPVIRKEASFPNPESPAARLLGKLGHESLVRGPRGLEDVFSLGTSRFPSDPLCARRAPACPRLRPYLRLSAALSRPPYARRAGAGLPQNPSLRLPSARSFARLLYRPCACVRLSCARLAVAAAPDRVCSYPTSLLETSSTLYRSSFKPLFATRALRCSVPACPLGSHAHRLSRFFLASTHSALSSVNRARNHSLGKSANSDPRQGAAAPTKPISNASPANVAPPRRTTVQRRTRV